MCRNVKAKLMRELSIQVSTLFSKNQNFFSAIDQLFNEIPNDCCIWITVCFIFHNRIWFILLVILILMLEVVLKAILCCLTIRETI